VTEENGVRSITINSLGLLTMAWKKGQSGNPKGRAAEKPFADALRMEIKAAGEDHQKLREIARKALDKAAGGDMHAISFVADRLDGKPHQAVEMTGETQYVVRMPAQFKSAEEWQAYAVATMSTQAAAKAN
jgi:hypothetical protein